MTDQPPLPKNLAGEPIDPGRDEVLIALRGLATGLLTGIGLLALVLLAIRIMRAGAPPSDRIDPNDPAVNLLLVGWFGSVFLGGYTAWRTLRGLLSPFRRWALALVAGIGTLVGGLVLAPVHYLAGNAGLIGAAVLALAGGAMLGRRAARRPVPRLEE